MHNVVAICYAYEFTYGTYFPRMLVTPLSKPYSTYTDWALAHEVRNPKT